MKTRYFFSSLLFLSIPIAACQASEPLLENSDATALPLSTSTPVEDTNPQNVSRIVSSSDNGESWQVMYQTNWLDLTNIYCVENLTCYALSEEKFILKTSDGGNSWNKLGTEDMSVHGDSPFGCATGGFCLLIESTTGGKVWTTHDGGTTWEKSGDSPVNSPESIACPISETCILVSRAGEVFDTQDGGKTWNSELASTGITYKKIICLDKSLCYIAGMVFTGEHGIVAKTINDGKGWEITGESPVRGLRSISCPTSDDCVSVGRFGVQVTHDGGKSWDELLGIDSGARSVGCSSPQNCFIIDTDGQIFKWNGGHLEKMNINNQFVLRNVSCTADEICYVVGVFTND